MKTMFGVLSIMIAFICYSISVLNQVYTKKLTPKHLVLFWVGLVFDVTGTVIMFTVAGRLKLDIHGLTGILGFILMAINAILATIAIQKTNSRSKYKFYIVSLTVWIIWLIPFFTGIFLNMNK
jgi:uncharacterized repeat protein (TIGR03987 family)